jgi:hypothetical protein
MRVNFYLAAVGIEGGAARDTACLQLMRCEEVGEAEKIGSKAVEE